MHLFPFEKIPPESKIIIYGFGKAGKDYFEQIKMTSYCKIICFIDKNFLDYKNLSTPIRPIYELKNMAGMYDFIVIAMMDEQNSEQAKRRLLAEGIRNENIVTSYNRWLECSQCEKEESAEFIKNPCMVHEIINDFILLGQGKRAYFSNLVRDIKNISKLGYTWKWITQILQMDLSEKEKIIFFCILNDAKVFSGKLTQQFIKSLENMPGERDTRYALAMDLSWYMTGTTDALYPKYFQDRRHLLKTLAETYNLSVSAPPDTVKLDMKRIGICVMSYQVPQNKGCIDGLVLRYANELCSLGYDVAVFVIGTFENKDCTFFIEPLYTCEKSYTYTEWNKTITHKAVRIYYRYETTIQRRLQGCLDDIYSFRPDVLLDMSDALFVQSYLLKDVYPIVYMPMRGCAASSYFHMFLTSNRGYCEKFNQTYHAVSSEQIFELRLGIVPLTDDSYTYDKESFGLKKDDFLIVTVGSRLNKEIQDDLAARMANLLQNYDAMRWVLVGDIPECLYRRYVSLLKKKRIIFWGYEQHLNALYRISDVYLNPRRTGGAISIALAMQEGLPIAILKGYSDAWSVLDECNGISESYDGLISYIEKLYLDQDLYHAVSKRMKREFRMIQPTETAKKVACACQKCYRDFHNRYNRSSEVLQHDTI